MNKFVLGALALSASGAPSFAGTGTEEWLKLDKDIESLASSLAPQSSPATVSGFVKTSYAKSWGAQADSDGDGVLTGADHDLGGFSLDNVRLNVQGTVGQFGVFVSVEGAQVDDLLTNPTPLTSQAPLPSHMTGGVGTAGPVGVLDAFATVKINDQLRGQVGQFRNPFLAESLHSEDQQLFMGYSALGQYWWQRDEGAQLSATFGQINVYGAVMNGWDQAGDRVAWVTRAEFVMGAAQTVEGAFGANGNMNLTVGAGYYDDNSMSHAQSWCADAALNMGAFSASAAMVDFKSDLGFALPGNAGGNPATTMGERPWNAVASFLVLPDVEVAARYEEFDDQDNTYAVTGGVNWYQSGHAAKLQLNYTENNNDSGNNDVDIWQIGLTASI